MKTKNLLYILPLAALVACEPEFDDIEFNGGSADFSRFVSVGNSLTAGFQSNALRRNKQVNSFPAIMAEQLKKVGGGDFKQPLLADGVGIGSSLNAEFGIFLAADCKGEVGPSPQPIAAAGQVDQFQTSIGADGPYNNVGVPGAKSYHLVAAGYGNPTNVPLGLANPYYARFADPTNFNETMIEAAVRANPTFFSLWIGNNDVLSYATTGGSGVDQTGNPDPSTYGGNDITDPTLFAGLYTQMITALTTNGAKGVVATIPDVTSIPYFTTIPIGTDAITDVIAGQLNSSGAYGGYNAALDAAVQLQIITAEEAARRKVVFTAGQINTFVVIDPSLTDISLPDPSGVPVVVPKYRQIVPGELLTLTTSGDSLACEGLGTAIAIQPYNHLTADEVNSIATATAAYNASIKSIAAANGIAVFDANARMKELATTGITDKGIDYSNSFIAGGAFSLDGVHPNTRGYAILANDFIDAINAAYGANIPKTDVSSYPAEEIVQ